jgi:hypothetical protein
MNWENIPKDLEKQIFNEPITTAWFVKDKIENNEKYDPKLLNVIAKDTISAFDVAKIIYNKNQPIPQILLNSISSHPRTAIRYVDELCKDFTKLPNDFWNVFLNKQFPEFAEKLLCPGGYITTYSSQRQQTHPLGIIAKMNTPLNLELLKIPGGQKILKFLTSLPNSNIIVAKTFLKQNLPIPQEVYNAACSNPTTAFQFANDILPNMPNQNVINTIAEDPNIALHYLASLPSNDVLKFMGEKTINSNIINALLNSVNKTSNTKHKTIQMFKQRHMTVPKILELNPENIKTTPQNQS